METWIAEREPDQEIEGRLMLETMSVFNKRFSQPMTPLDLERVKISIQLSGSIMGVDGILQMVRKGMIELHEPQAAVLKLFVDRGIIPEKLRNVHFHPCRIFSMKLFMELVGPHICRFEIIGS